MSLSEPRRDTPEYIEAVVAVKPQFSDKRDIRIRQLISKVFEQEAWAADAFELIRQQQLAYIRDLVHNIGDVEHTRHATQEILGLISGQLRTVIEEGEEHLSPLHQRSVVATSNHLGMYKLSPLNPQTELGDEVPKYEGYDFMYPFPLYFAAFSPVARLLGNELSYASLDYPGVFGQIHSDAGFIHIHPQSQVPDGGRTDLLKQQTAELFERQPKTLLAIFPEGGTGGKYNEAGPYDLRAFRTGSYMVAAELGLPILPVAQYFDPHEGMRLKVFEPFYPQPGGKPDYQQLADRDRTNIQDWLKYKEQGQDCAC